MDDSRGSSKLFKGTFVEVHLNVSHLDVCRSSSEHLQRFLRTFLEVFKNSSGHPEVLLGVSRDTYRSFQECFPTFLEIPLNGSTERDLCYSI